MMLKYLSAAWETTAPALANHLWQSTLFLLAAGLLTLVLRKNHARIRYWLWLAASAKFLIPFSLLALIGSNLAWSHVSAGTTAGLYPAMEQVGQPFSQPTASLIPHATSSTAVARLRDMLPALLVAAWLCGFLAIISVWYSRWRRVAAVLREAVPVHQGCEVEMLRRLERAGRTRMKVEMTLSRASLEPGIFGIVRPVLIWPEGISHRLEDAHLEAILVHELRHVRRRDNLAAALHMVVEALFWFHPLVWWLGTRLVEERERACDEEVLEMGSERQVYAESILKVCEFCIGSPLACVSGVTGADLKKRMVSIMTERNLPRLGLSKQLLLIVAALLAVVLPVALGTVNATASGVQTDSAAIAPTYETVSVKANKSAGINTMNGILVTPVRLNTMASTLHMLIGMAYGVVDDQIAGGPSWLNNEKYDIQAQISSSTSEELRKLSPEQRNIEQKRMLQELLANRFELMLHSETKELPEYLLVIAENGPKLQEAKPGDTYPNGIKGPDGLPAGPHIEIMQLGKGLTGQSLSMTEIANLLTRETGRTVLDKTGLKGNYDITLHWDQDTQHGPGDSGNSNAAPDSPGSSIFTALQEQLGLELKPQTGQAGVLIIDHAEEPSED